MPHVGEGYHVEIGEGLAEAIGPRVGNQDEAPTPPLALSRKLGELLFRKIPEEVVHVVRGNAKAA